jgi:acetylornithine deacetylase/succinyl-diaminopimelate desuccinylase-like protein
MSNQPYVCFIAVALLLSTTLLRAQTNATPDWTKAKPEILERYRAMLQIDSTAGHETLVVDYLKKVLAAEGIPSQTFAMDPNRANLVARLKGNGSKKPLLIFAHTDVVPVQREKWPVDPFGAVMKDGYVWGRGSKDDKPVLTANLIVFLTLKRLGVKLDRDVIFMAESGEEADTVGVGMNYMVREHLKEIEAEFAMTEGGGGTIEDGKVTRMNIGTAEKLPARVRLVATGTAGHGSVPRLDNALIHLGAAVEKVGRWETPMELNDTTRAYFAKLATISTPEKAARYNALLSGGEASRAAQAYLREHEPGLYSMLRTSVVPTMLKAGVGLNVIPSEAEATLDIRAAPGEDLDKFFTNMAKLIDDPEVKIVPLPRMRPPSPASRLDNEMFRVMSNAAQTIYPGAVILPSMSTGASDNSQLRAIGIQSYGVGPASTESDALNYPAHGDVERLAESSLYPFVQYVWTVVTEIAAHK